MAEKQVLTAASVKRSAQLFNLLAVASTVLSISLFSIGMLVADKKMAFLRNEAKVMREVFGYDARILGADEVHRDYVKDAETFGALHEPDGIGVHPLKLAYGYLRKARELGVKVHPASPVVGFETRNGVHLLRTPGGTVRARAVGFATGGYTSNGLHRSLDSKIMPILSNSLVTRPLTEAEIEATNFVTTEVITDTRTLRFYYRRLPDNRVQIGSRSSITGADAPNPRHLQLLIGGLHRKFALADLHIADVRSCALFYGGDGLSIVRVECCAVIDSSGGFQLADDRQPGGIVGSGDDAASGCQLGGGLVRAVVVVLD